MRERSWLPDTAQDREREVLGRLADLDLDGLADEVAALTAKNRRIHERDCINLNPATNLMNPRAEALLAAGLGSRPSLGYPGLKYETGLEAIEQIEVLTADLVCRVFDAGHAELRVASGAMANLYAFMATCSPGDAIIAPPATVGGHVTHHRPGAAGLYGLEIHPAPIDPDRYEVDVDGVRELARRVRPRLITVGASLNLAPPPVAELRAVADEVGAALLFDAAHVCGMIAGGRWPNPLVDGADLMTMSTYKSLGGPPSGLLVTNDAALAERVDAIAHPGLTANFDAGNVAALAITMLDWLSHGADYASAMVDNAAALANRLNERGLPVVASGSGPGSHQLAIDARSLGGGDPAARRLRRANLLACAIGLPSGEGDGLRLGSRPR